jgi:hypothetical protein
MTAIAVRLYRKSGFPVMASPTGITALHLRHGKASGIFSGCKNTIVTIRTLVESNMKLVTEKGWSGLFNINFNLFCGKMAPIAIALHRKSEITVMARTARAILLHLRHRITSIIAVRPEKCVVAIAAAVHLEMPSMRKSGIFNKRNVFNGMTLPALLRYRKCGFAIMTGTTGQSLLHLCHTVCLSLGTRCKDFVVAIITLVDTHVKIMAEVDFPGFRNIKNNILGREMTSATASGNTKCNVRIMAGTA